VGAAAGATVPNGTAVVSAATRERRPTECAECRLVAGAACGCHYTLRAICALAPVRVHRRTVIVSKYYVVLFFCFGYF
jgi:hypothetical protein